MTETKKCHGRISIGVALLFLAAIAVIAACTRIWVLTAVPIGFLFGFFLQKGDLCGSSAFSEVLLMKDWRKMGAMWICIVVSMVGFAVLDLLGLVRLPPKPLIWLSAVVGGILFGVGMVLAGGCVSGCLFKAGMGNLNSMVALLGIPLGIGMVEYGPLASFHKYLQGFVVKAADGGSVTLSSLTGIPFWSLALFFGLATGAVIFAKFRRKDKGNDDSPQKSRLERLCTRRWKAWQAGLAIGLLAIPAYLSSAASGRNYPWGVTHGVLHVQLLATDQSLKHVWKAAPAPAAPSSPAQPAAASAPAPAAAPNSPSPAPKKIVWWLVAIVTAMVLGSWASASLSGEAKLLPKPPEQILVAFFGGVLVGVGATLATGCVVGNILSGWALMSVGMFLFGIVTVLANWATTYFYLMGGSLFRSE